MARCDLGRASLARATITAAAFLALWMAAAGPLEAQKLRVFRLTTQIENVELESGDGWGFSALIPASALEVELGWRRVSGGTTRNGRVCINYELTASCKMSDIYIDSQLSTFSAGLRLPIGIGDVVTISPGALVGLGRIDSSARSEVGLAPAYFSPNGAQVSWGGFLELALRPVPRVPVGFIAAVGHTWQDYNGCSDNPIIYGPFCGAENYTELRFGAEVGLRR